MFNSPFQADQNAEPQFSFNGGQQCNPQQQYTQAQPQQNRQSANTQFSTSDVEQMVANLQVSTMSNPVKIVEPSYIVTETQLKQILGLKDVVQPQPQYAQPQYQPQPQYYQPQPQYVQPQYNPQQMIQPVNYQQMQKRTMKDQFAEALQAPRPTSNNMIDSIGNVTFGTVGRIGHTFTGLIDNIIDVVTMGYGSKR